MFDVLVYIWSYTLPYPLFLVVIKFICQFGTLSRGAVCCAGGATSCTPWQRKGMVDMLSISVTHTTFSSINDPGEKKMANQKANNERNTDHQKIKNGAEE